MSTYNSYVVNNDLRSLIISPFGPSDDYSQISNADTSSITRFNLTSTGNINTNSDGTRCQPHINNQIFKPKSSISGNNTQQKTKSSKSNRSPKIKPTEQKSGETSTPKLPAGFEQYINTNTDSSPSLKKYGRWNFSEGQKIKKYTASKMDIWIDARNTQKWYPSIKGFKDASDLYYWLNFGTGLSLMTQYRATRKFSVSTMSTDDIFSDSVVTESKQTTKGNEIEIVIINYEIIHIQKWKTLYGIIELNAAYGKYKHQLTHLLTSQQIYIKYGIEHKDLPEGIRETQQFKNTLKMKKNEKLTYKALMDTSIKYKFVSNKKGVYDTDFDKETKVIERCLTKWRIKAAEEKKVIEIQDLVPILFIESNRGRHRTDWAYFVRIKPFGYDVAMIFRFKNNRFEFKRVLLDVEEVKSVHNLLGEQNINEMEQEFQVPTGHYHQILTSKRPRSERMNKTKAFLQFDQELKRKKVIKGYKEVQQRLVKAQKEVNHKERVVGKLINKNKEKQVLQERQIENKRRKSLRLMETIQEIKDEKDVEMEQKAKKNQKKKLKQKLKEIEKLEIKQKAGGQLLPQQIEKIHKKKEYEARLNALRAVSTSDINNHKSSACKPVVARSNTDKARIIINKFRSMEQEIMRKNEDIEKLTATNKTLNASRNLILSQNECLKQRWEQYQQENAKNRLKKNAVIHALSQNKYLKHKLEQVEYQLKGAEFLKKENERLRRENERLKSHDNGDMKRELMAKQQTIDTLKCENEAYQALGDKILKQQMEEYEEKQVLHKKENKVIKKENKKLKKEVDGLKVELKKYEEEIRELKYRMSVVIPSPLVSLKSLERVVDQCEVEVEMEKGKEWKCIED